MSWVMGEDSHGRTSRRLGLWCPASALREPGKTGLVGVPSTTWLCGSGEVAPFWFLVFILVKMVSLTPCPASLRKLLEDQVRLYMR